MTRPEQDIDGVTCDEQEALFEGGTHAGAHPMAGFKSSLFVMHHFVGKHKHWLAACSDYFGSLGVGDHGVQDDPLFDGTEGKVLGMLPGRFELFVEGQLKANELDPWVAQQAIVDGAIHESPLKLCNICKLKAYATDTALAVWRPPL